MLCFQRLFQNKHRLNLCFAVSFNINIHGDYMTKGMGYCSTGSHLNSDMGTRKLWVAGTSLPELAARWSLQCHEQPGCFFLWPQETLKNESIW